MSRNEPAADPVDPMDSQCSPTCRPSPCYCPVAAEADVLALEAKVAARDDEIAMLRAVSSRLGKENAELKAAAARLTRGKVPE
jgi:hypothetical protein